MADTLADAILDALMGLELGSSEQDASNRFSLDGLTLRAGQEGALEIGARRLEASALRLAAGSFTLEIGRLALHKLTAQVRTEAGRPRLQALEADDAELSGVKVHGPLLLPAPSKAQGGGTWSLVPLASAEGVVRAKIVDAHLLFDADVTVPIRHGQVNFNDASVEHVGPDSRMGVSRMGIYVDAPNGRSYLYQFPSTTVGGVEYERRGALLGPMVTDRGKLQLQAFGEKLLGEPRAGQGLGLTEQARLMFDRTAVSGEVQVGDGRFAAPGVQAEVAGRAEGRNVVRVHSEAVGRGLTLEMPSVSVRQVAAAWRGIELGCAALSAALVLRISTDRGQLHFALELPSVNLTGLRLRPKRAS